MKTSNLKTESGNEKNRAQMRTLVGRGFLRFDSIHCIRFIIILSVISIVSIPASRITRQPASVFANPKLPSAHQGKIRVLQQKKSKISRHHGKGNASLDIEISAPGKGQVEAGTVINLEATIEALSNVQDLKFLWILPDDGITVLSGPTEGQIGHLNAGEITTVNISVRSDSAENRQIHFHAYRFINGEAMGQMTQYNSVDQEKIEAHAESKAEILRRSAELSGIQQKLYQ